MSERTIALTRVYDAPRERVFAAWTRAEHLAGWFAPGSYTVPVCEIDPQPGGAFRVCMRSPEGKDAWVRGVFHEVRAPERLVMVFSFDDAKAGGRLEEEIGVALAEDGARTRLTLTVTARGVGGEAERMLEGMQESWARTVTRLDSQVKPNR